LGPFVRFRVRLRVALRSMAGRPGQRQPQPGSLAATHCVCVVCLHEPGSV
jgi:hypothetical protein